MGWAALYASRSRSRIPRPITVKLVSFGAGDHGIEGLGPVLVSPWSRPALSRDDRDHQSVPRKCQATLRFYSKHRSSCTSCLMLPPEGMETSCADQVRLVQVHGVSCHSQDVLLSLLSLPKLRIRIPSGFELPGGRRPSG